MGEIVVGVDGSAGSDAALRWALEEARLRGSTLRVVHAYQRPQVTLGDIAAATPGVVPPTAFSADEVERLRAAAEQNASAVVDGALRRAGDGALDGLEITTELVDGAAAESLIGAGKGAELLVIGSRGHGGFLGLLLGSVSQQCAHHPPCPLVILPPAKEDESDSG